MSTEVKLRQRIIDRLLDVYEPFTVTGFEPTALEERRAGRLARTLQSSLLNCPELGTDAKRWIRLAERFLDDCELQTQKTGSRLPCHIALDFIRSALHQDLNARECFAPGKSTALWFMFSNMKEDKNYKKAREMWADICQNSEEH